MKDVLRDFSKYVQIVKDAHEKNSRKKGKPQIRIFDGATFYAVHPIWCACTILQEPNLDEKIRKYGALALLFHDILEDTFDELPEDLPEQSKQWIKELTYESSKQAREKVWEKEPVIRLFKLYDATNNFLDGFAWRNKENLIKDKKYLKKLIKDVEKNFGHLNIVKIAKGLL